MDESVKVKTPIASTEMPWKTFTRYTVTKEYWYLWFQNKIVISIPIYQVDAWLEQTIKTKIT